MPAAPPRHPGARRHGLGASGLGEGEVRCRETPEPPVVAWTARDREGGVARRVRGGGTEVLSRRGH